MASFDKNAMKKLQDASVESEDTILLDVLDTETFFTLLFMILSVSVAIYSLLKLISECRKYRKLTNKIKNMNPLPEKSERGKDT